MSAAWQPSSSASSSALAAVRFASRISPPDSRFRELLAYAHKLHLAAVPHDSALKQTLAYARKLRVTEN